MQNGHTVIETTQILNERMHWTGHDNFKYINECELKFIVWDELQDKIDEDISQLDGNLYQLLKLSISDFVIFLFWIYLNEMKYKLKN